MTAKTCLFCDSIKHTIFLCEKSKKRAITIMVAHIDAISADRAKQFNQQNYKYSKQDLKACVVHFHHVTRTFGDEVYKYNYKLKVYDVLYKINLQKLFSIVNNLIHKIVYAIKKTKENVCPICYENYNYNMNNMITTPCDHLFCKTCINTYSTTLEHKNVCCPLCRYQFNHDELRDMGIAVPLDRYLLNHIESERRRHGLSSDRSYSYYNIYGYGDHNNRHLIS